MKSASSLRPLRPFASFALSLFFWAALLWLPAGFALDRVELGIGDLAGEGWRIEGLSLGFELAENPDAGPFALAIERITLPALPQPIETLALRCDRGSVSPEEIRCDQGALALHHPLLETGGAGLAFRLDLREGALDLALTGLGVLGGRLALESHLDRSAADLHLRAAQLDLAKLSSLSTIFPKLDGRLDGRLEIDALHRNGAEIALETQFTEIRFSLGDGGVYQGEGLTGRWNLGLRHAAGVWRGDQRLELSKGAILTPWAYLEPIQEGGPITLSSLLEIAEPELRVRLADLHFRQPPLLEIKGSAELAPGSDRPLETLALEIAPVHLAELHRHLLQPVLAESPLENLELAGRIALRYEQRGDGSPYAEIDLDHVSLADGTPQHRFALHGVTGRLIQGRGEISHLGWEGGHLLGGLRLGAAEARLNLTPRTVELASPLSVPLLDGRLNIDEFRYRLDDANARFQGFLEPISLPAFTEAMGWPPLAGKLSGMIPGVGYRDGKVDVEGEILIQAFDGTVLIDRLHLEELFGPLPVLTADIQVRGLDLDALTGAFAFGRITGRLEGEVNGLRLEGWSPVAFDARLRTPQGDPGPHRINQRAVDNIANLGGAGISGAVSRGLLRWFDEFGYARLGVSCRLGDGICEMDGIEPAEGGYVLVKGGGIPRIDVVGYNRHTDWTLLLQKLREIGKTPPVVE